MPTEPERIELTGSGHHSQAYALRKTKLLREMPPPQQDGELTHQLECGNAVVRVYRHTKDPTHTDTFTISRRTPEGMLAESAHIGAADLGDMIRALKATRSVVLNGLTPEASHRMNDAYWAERERARSSRKGTGSRER